MKVSLYTKSDCGLCREAEEVRRRLRRTIQFQLALVDIEACPSVFERYRDRVPVVEVDGEEVASAPLDEERLRAALSA